MKGKFKEKGELVKRDFGHKHSSMCVMTSSLKYTGDNITDDDLLLVCSNSMNLNADIQAVILRGHVVYIHDTWLRDFTHVI